MVSCLSPVSMYGGYLRRCVTSAGLSSQTIEIDNETTIHLWAPKKTNSSTISKPKPALVLIHGFGPESYWQWKQQIVSFSRHFDIYVPDLVFFGQSTTKSSERSEVFQATCIVKLLEKCNLAKYSIIGTSYGGFVAYNIAKNWPERVEKVVIASSGINIRKRDNDILVKRAGAEKIEELMLPTSAQRVRAFMKLCVHNLPYVPDFLVNDFLNTLYTENTKEKKELLNGLTFAHDDTINVSPLSQEVLIVWGEHDQVFPLEIANELKGLLGKNTKMEIIKNTSHLPQIEKPTEFNKIIQKFLCEKE